MSTYVPTDWVDGSTPVNAANLDKLEQAVAAAYPRLTPTPLVEGNWLTVAGGAMVWAPAPAGGGGGGLDWEGPWAAPTAYVKGDVVTHDGVTYGAVNDSTGQTPPAASPIPIGYTPIPLVTVLPTTDLFDGKEVIFTDSLTAPTYAWRLRYVAAKASNKWIFVGGSPLSAPPYQGPTADLGTAFADVGNPTPVVPVAGVYAVAWSAMFEASGSYPNDQGHLTFSGGGITNGGFAFGVYATAWVGTGASTDKPTPYKSFRYTLTAGTALQPRAMRRSAGGLRLYYITLEATPVAVGG